MSESKFELVGYDLYYDRKGPNREYTVTEGSITSGNYGTQCLRCKNVTPVRECSNCGGATYQVGASKDRSIGLFCRACDSGFTSVTCGSCGTNNPVAKTFGEFKSGMCFVATATFGNADAPEVIYLSAFRDESLSQSNLGRGFIRTYYKVSPFFAAVIAKSDLLRLLVRKSFLQPLIFLLRHLRR